MGAETVGHGAAASAAENNVMSGLSDAGFREMCIRDRSKAELRKAIVRAEELNTVIAKLYEDKVLGKLPEERFDALAKKFESEQGELKARAEELQNALAIADDEERNLQEFIKTVKRYTEITELDTEILNSLIERIEIGEMCIRDRCLIWGGGTFLAKSTPSLAESLPTAEVTGVQVRSNGANTTEDFIVLLSDCLLYTSRCV